MERRKRCRSSQVGRPCSRYAAMAAPTSAGSGSRLCRPPLPRIRSCDWSQSMSSSASLMISQARSPRRASSSSTARSRRPTAVNLSQLSIARCACSAAIAFGIGGVVVHVATDGTPAASPAVISPRNSPKRSKDLSALATPFRAGGAIRFDSCRTNAIESLGRSSCRRTSACPKRQARNCRANLV